MSEVSLSAQNTPPVGFMPIQQAKLATAPPSGAGWIHEVKLDGYRMQLRVADGEGQWWSRNGYDWTERLRDFRGLVKTMPAGVYDGEICLLDADGQPDFSVLRAMMGRRQVGRMEGELVFFVFDLLHGADRDLRPTSLQDRRGVLDDLLPAERDGHPSVRRVTSLPGGGPELLHAACAMGLEGIVSKRLDSPYQGGAKRYDTWLKSKCRPSQEVVIGGWTSDGPRLRALLAGVWEGGALRYVGSVGTGFPAATATALMTRLEEIEVERSPFGAGDAPKRGTGLHWARPELVAEVEIAEWTGAGKLRQASFKRLREPGDKSADQVQAANQSPEIE